MSGVGQSFPALERICAGAIEAIEPGAQIREALALEGSSLKVRTRGGEPLILDVEPPGSLALVSAGKAAFPMAKAAMEILAGRVDETLIAAKTRPSWARDGFDEDRIVMAGHPTPNDGSLRAGRDLTRIADGLGDKDTLVLLLSGGASSLLTAPAAGLTLEDVRCVNEALLAAGASIGEINTVRKHLSDLKGGGLARAASPARVVVLSISDVPGDDPSVIGSGPAAADDTTYEQALDVLARYRLMVDVPPVVIDHLGRGASGELPETVKSGDAIVERVDNLVICSARDAVLGAAKMAGREGFEVEIAERALCGEASLVGAEIARGSLERREDSGRPSCLIYSGETTVTVRGRGVGGRNQELAMGAALALDGTRGVSIAALATDGEDGPSRNAGAMVDGGTMEAARRMGLSPEDALAGNDTAAFFERAGGFLRTGPTGSNVADLVVVLIEPLTG